MAADDDDRGPAPDPWDEIVAEGLGGEAGEASFRFDDVAADAPSTADAPSADDSPAAPGDSPFPAADEDADATPSADATADAFVEGWLSEGDGNTATPPLAVFDPGEHSTGSSGIDIGTGGSGVALHGAAEQEEIGTDDSTAAGTDAEQVAAGWPAAEEGPAGDHRDDDGAGAAFPDVAAGAVTTAPGVARKPAHRPVKPAKKAGLFGQAVGILLGGALAIPIVAGILIGYIWLGGPDTMGIRKTPLAFLLPPKGQPQDSSSAPATEDTEVAGGSALDNLPPVTEPAEPGAGADMPPDESAPAEPPAVVDMPPEPAPATDVAAVDAPGFDAPGFDAPGLDNLGATPTTPVRAEPPPLDTAALDAAVGDAAALGEALGAVDDRENAAYKKLRTRWYRALARVAEELVAIENAAATSGRPLAGAPDSVATLHDVISRRETLAAELTALAPLWLAYAERGSDGVVVPATFESARRVGPYWTVRASLTGSDGQPKDLTIISRSEPAAIAGDRVVVTGLAIDGGVIWAADVRTAGGVGPAGF